MTTAEILANHLADFTATRKFETLTQDEIVKYFKRHIEPALKEAEVIGENKIKTKIKKTLNL